MKKIEEKNQKKNKYLIELGKQICKIRNSKGLTQEVLSDRAHMDTSYLSDIETGKSNPTFMALVKIAKQLDCDVAAFSKSIPKETFLININIKKDEEQYLTKLGRQIREIRHSEACTQKELGKRAGMRGSYIGEIERGKRNIYYLTLVKIAEALGCDVAAFTKNIPQ